MLIRLDELPAVLRDKVTDLRDCVTRALRDFVSDHKTLRVRYSPRTEASIIRDHQVTDLACLPRRLRLSLDSRTYCGRRRRNRSRRDWDPRRAVRPCGSCASYQGKG